MNENISSIQIHNGNYPTLVVKAEPKTIALTLICLGIVVLLTSK